MPGRPRVLFLGDSFVWGFDVEARERFTDKLQALHPEWDIYNLGVCGYGTDQEYLLLQQCYDEYQPAIVFLIVCSDNDHDDNSSNIIQGAYYKPYYTFGSNGLALHGIPVPQAEEAFYMRHRALINLYLTRLVVRAWYRVRAPAPIHNTDPTAPLILALRDYVNQKGAVLAVGVEGPNFPLEKFLVACRIPMVDLTVERYGPCRYPSFGGHWTPKGHDFVCGEIESVLRKLVAAPPGIFSELARQSDPTEALPLYHFAQGGTFNNVGKTGLAIEEYEEALRLKPEFPEALNNLAWLFATSPDGRFRSGWQAVRLAEQACFLTHNQEPLMIGTAAAAYAESGQFAKAIELAQEAIKLAEDTGDKEIAARNSQLLEKYKNGEPYRDVLH